MSDDIGFEKQAPAEVPESFEDSDHQKLKQDALKKLDRIQADKEVRAEAGMTEIPKTPESIPKELPKLCFQIIAKSIHCDKFALTPDEATAMAKHLSIIIGPVSSRIYSVVIVAIVIISKVSDCFGKISSKFSKNKDRDEDPQFME